jgi:hypothetical protein
LRKLAEPILSLPDELTAIRDVNATRNLPISVVEDELGCILN